MDATNLRGVKRLHGSVMALSAFGLLIPAGLGLWSLARLAERPDHRLIVWAVGHRTHALTLAAHVASALGRGWILILATTILGLVLRTRLGWRALGPLIAVLGSALLQHLLKGLVDRPRPVVRHLEHVSGSSFPSGHATESTAVGVALFLLLRNRPRNQRIAGGMVLAALVTAISSSRIYLGVHYPTDVMAGIVLGSAWAIAATWWVG